MVEDDRWRAFSSRVRQDSNGRDLILDSDSALESILHMLAGLCFLFSLTSGMMWLEGKHPISLWVPIGLGSLCALAFFLRGKVDDYYVLDFAEQRLVFQRGFFGVTRRAHVCRFNELSAVLLHPKRESGKQGVWWEYGLSFLGTNGRTMEVIPTERVEHSAAKSDASRLAVQLGLKLCCGEPEQHMRVRRNRLGPEVEFRPHSWSVHLVDQAVMILVGLAISAFLFWLFYLRI